MRISHHANALLCQQRRLQDVDTIDFNAAAVRFQQTVQHPQGSGFAGTVMSKQSRDRAITRAKTYAVDRSDFTEMFDEIVDANHRQKHFRRDSGRMGELPIRRGNRHPARRLCHCPQPLLSG